MQGNQLPSVNVCETFKYAERHDLHITDQLRQHYIEKLSESSVSESVISTCGQPQECNTLLGEQDILQNKIYREKNDLTNL